MSLRKSLNSFVTYISGVSNKQYQKYSDFNNLTPEQILELPLDQISRTMLNKDSNTVLTHAQMKAVRTLSSLKYLSDKHVPITPEFRQSYIDKAKGVSILDKLIVDTDRDIRKERELELRQKRLGDKEMTEEEKMDLRLLELNGGRRNTKKTKTQTKKKTNKKKRRTCKK
jgi:hypothetical protein